MDATTADVTTPLGAWASVRGYFTPATLFLVINIVIGTIALTSRSRDQRRRREHLHHDYAHHQQHGHYQEPPLHDPHQQEYHYYQQQPQYATPPPPPPLARTSSVLDRLRSIGLYRFRSDDFPPEYAAPGTNNHHDAFAPVEKEAATKEYARSRSEPAPAREETRPPPTRTMKKSGTEVVRKKSQASRAPATRVVEAVAKEFVGSLRQEPASPQKAEYLSYQKEEEAEYVPPPAPMRAPPPLSRTSSVLDRLRSLGLYSFLAADQPAAPATDSAFSAAPAADKKHAPAHYDRSRSEPARQQASGKEEKKQVAAPKMAKSSSTTRKATAAAGPRLVSQQSVNTRAEAFIDSFRKGQSQKQQHHHHHHHDDDDEHDDHAVPPPPAPLARTSSVLDRLRSFSLYLRPGDPAVPEDPVVVNKKAKQAAQYGRSRSEPAREQGKRKARQGPEARLSKTSSENNISEEEAAPAEECVDARADDFINKFRHQLQLQRLNSLLNYSGSKQ